MSRGENQKPVTNSYRDNWDSIFGQKKKAPAFELKPCTDCRGSGLLACPDHSAGDVYVLCHYCGGFGVIPTED